MSAHPELARRAQLISSLDEKYVSNAVTFAAMHAAGTMVVDGAPLRGPTARSTAPRSAVGSNG